MLGHPIPGKIRAVYFSRITSGITYRISNLFRKFRFGTTECSNFIPQNYQSQYDRLKDNLVE